MPKYVLLHNNNKNQQIIKYQPPMSLFIYTTENQVTTAAGNQV